MDNAVSPSGAWRHDGAPSSLDASDDFESPDAQHYCPIRLLCAFALLMAGHGHCVNTSMMLGDREYAMWQLASAHTLDDPELREISARLFAYFDNQQAPVPVGMRP
ncbi:hypothetical protein GCM10027034_26560 [Ramlibacter solisilvae]|uniref:hypothetical protein n=1 Tax=Ramlibacter tataouinensis TaxID=94132 RepID=UPI000777E0B0|nr:hypothetical protein [Ramlibacter tataouinensis]